MIYCTKCGAMVDENTKFCPECGAFISTSHSEKEPWEDEKKDLGTKISELNDTPDTTEEFSESDINGNKVMAVLSYIGLLVLVPLFAARESKFARFHANQGLVLMICNIVWEVLKQIVVEVITAVSPTLGTLTNTVCNLVNIFLFVLMIVGIVNAVKGRAKELPVIGKIKLLK